MLFAKYLSKKYKNQLVDTRLDSLKTSFKNVVQKIDEFLRNKIADAVANFYSDKILKTKPVEEIIISPQKREEILNDSRQEL